jgi:hypothetical protein|tara:strand:+ start:55 stop:558 length:504 start_codon:yes stop_codon:yes gene_type:complete
MSWIEGGFYVRFKDMKNGLIKDKIRQDGFLSDISPKWWSVLIWIIIGIIFFGNSLSGQGWDDGYSEGRPRRTLTTIQQPELVPYQIVPIDIQPGDCNLEVGIQLVHPFNVENMMEPQQQETLEIIYQRIGYEIVNPQMSAGSFQVDGKLYHLIRIPYTAGSSSWDFK